MTTLLPIVVAAPLIIVFAVVCLREPLRVALPIYTALIPFGGLVSLGSSSFSSASSLLGLLLGAGLMAQFVTGRQFTPRWSAAVPVWTVFLGLATATTLWTVNRSATISGLIVLTSLVVVFVLVTLSDVDRSTVRRTETSLLIGSCGGRGLRLLPAAVPGRARRRRRARSRKAAGSATACWVPTSSR